MARRPAPALLVFDGDCAFCSGVVETLRDVLPWMPETTPSHGANLDELGLSQWDVDHYVWYLTDRHHYAGHLALSALLRSQPAPVLRFAGWLLATAPFSLLAAGAYAIIARYRHVLPGGTPACAIARDR